MMKSLIGHADQVANNAYKRLQDTAEELQKSEIPRTVVKAAQVIGMPVEDHAQISSIFERLGLKTARPRQLPHLPQEILEAIAGELDLKTRQNFALSSRRFAEAASSAVQSLTFHGAHDLQYSLTLLEKDGRTTNLSNHGLSHLTLEADNSPDSEYDKDDLKSIPAWMRESLEAVTVKAPLTAAAWDDLKTFPNLKKIELADKAGRPHNDVLEHLPADQPVLHLSMPMPDVHWQQLGRFNELKEIYVSVTPGHRLADVVSSFSLEKNKEGESNCLKNTEISGLSFTVNPYGPRAEQISNFHENDIGDLPKKLKSLQLSGVSLSAAALEHLKSVPLESVELNHSILLSGNLLKVLLEHPTLKKLCSFSSDLKTADAQAIAASRKLVDVRLPYNGAIGDAGIRALIGNKHITHLNIAKCGGSERLLNELALNRPAHVQQIKFEL